MDLRSPLFRDRFEQLLKEADAESKEARTPEEKVGPFYRLLRKMVKLEPSVKPITLEGLPDAHDYNAFMESVMKDMFLLSSQSEYLKGSTSTSFELAETISRTFLGRVRRLEQNVSLLRERVRMDTGTTVYRDTFVDDSLLDREAVADNVANIDSSAQKLTLAIEKETDYRGQFIVEIGEGSNGLPGNSHTIYRDGDAYRFYGEDNLHADLSTIIDGDKETYFEYEAYSVPQTEIDRFDGCGFSYHEPVSWGRAEGLTLSLRIVFPEPKQANKIRLVPFVDTHMGATPPVLEEIIVDDGTGVRQELRPGIFFSKDTTVFFGRQLVKYIIVTLKQSLGYLIEAGHYRVVTPEGLPTEGKLPSIVGLGVRYDPRTRKLIQPSTESLVKPDPSLVYPFRSDTVNKVTVEPILARRYQIGIRDITVANVTFKNQSSYVSTPFVVNEGKEIKEIALSRDVEVTAVNSCRTYISIDNCKTWYEVLNDYTRFIINGPTGKHIVSLPSAGPVKDVRVRIDLATDDTSSSPQVSSYTLTLVTQNTE